MKGRSKTIRQKLPLPEQCCGGLPPKLPCTPPTCGTRHCSAVNTTPRPHLAPADKAKARRSSPGYTAGAAAPRQTALRRCRWPWQLTQTRPRQTFNIAPITAWFSIFIVDHGHRTDVVPCGPVATEYNIRACYYPCCRCLGQIVASGAAWRIKLHVQREPYP